MPIETFDFRIGMIFLRWLNALKAEKVSSALVHTMGDAREITGLKINNEYWWNLLQYFHIDPLEVVRNYVPKYGYDHAIFQAFADWCRRKQ